MTLGIIIAVVVVAFIIWAFVVSNSDRIQPCQDGSCEKSFEIQEEVIVEPIAHVAPVKKATKKVVAKKPATKKVAKK